MSNQLVTLQGNEAFTDSMVIANGTGNQHNSVTRIIRNYLQVLMVTYILILLRQDLEHTILI